MMKHLKKFNENSNPNVTHKYSISDQDTRILNHLRGFNEDFSNDDLITESIIGKLFDRLGYTDEVLKTSIKQTLGVDDDASKSEIIEKTKELFGGSDNKRKLFRIAKGLGVLGEIVTALVVSFNVPWNNWTWLGTFIYLLLSHSENNIIRKPWKDIRNGQFFNDKYNEKNYGKVENLERIDEGWKDWLVGILVSASALFSNPASAQEMTDEEIKTEIVDSWEKFKSKAEEKQKDTTDNYLWSIYKDTVNTALSKCPTGCDEDTLYKIDDVVQRLKVDKDGNITDVDEWRLGTTKMAGKEPHAYSKSVGKYRGGEPRDEEGFVTFKNLKDKTDYYQKDKQGWKKAGWDKEKTKKRGEDVSTKYTQKRPGQKIDRWEE